MSKLLVGSSYEGKRSKLFIEFIQEVHEVDKWLSGPYQDQDIRLTTGQFSKHYSGLLTACYK